MTTLEKWKKMTKKPSRKQFEKLAKQLGLQG